jgi:hypothetical protein
LDIVLGASMAPTAVRLVLVEGQNGDGVTVEEDSFEFAPVANSATSDAVDQVIAAIDGTREGAVEGGFQLTSTGVTWTDPADVAALREELAARDMRNVMLVSPLLAAAALTQTVGQAMGYEHIAMLFVEPGSATLAVVEVADGSIVDLHRRHLESASQGAIAAELAAMIAGLDAQGAWPEGVFLIGCGTDIVGIKTALAAITPLDVSAAEEPDMALARGAARASANAPLFASSTAALAYALDPGTGEVSPRGPAPTYLDISANADLGERVRAYSALNDDYDETPRRRRPMFLAGSALAGIGAVVAGVVVVSLTSDRPTSAVRHQPGVSAATPAQQVPTQVPSNPPEAQLPPPSLPPAPVPAVAAPPAPPPQAELPVPSSEPPAPAVAAPPPAPAAPVHRAPAERAPEYLPTPVRHAAPAPPPAAPPPSAPPPAAVPPPPPQYQPPAQPPITMYLHFPFVTVPIPINPPPPPPPPAPAQ